MSSLANARGGTVLYGIPEDISGEIPIPQDLGACGMIIPPKLPETVESILLEAVDPVEAKQNAVKGLRLDCSTWRRNVHPPASCG